MPLAVLDDNALPQTPFPLFTSWFAAAREAPRADPTAMTLSTINAEGRPAARIVLLKQHDERGFVFYTNYASRKGRELEARPHAALTFWWPWIERQVRIEGTAEKAGAAEADAYFATRPRDSQIGAWASAQSAILPSRADLEAKAREYERKFAGRPVPRPPHWGGLRVVPDLVEFWHDREGRLHDRIIYTRARAAGWQIQRLFP